MSLCTEQAKCVCNNVYHQIWTCSKGLFRISVPSKMKKESKYFILHFRVYLQGFKETVNPKNENFVIIIYCFYVKHKKRCLAVLSHCSFPYNEDEWTVKLQKWKIRCILFSIIFYFILKLSVMMLCPSTTRLPLTKSILNSFTSRQHYHHI